MGCFYETFLKVFILLLFSTRFASAAMITRRHSWILILDFGSQYTQLIARRLREFNIYCEIHPFNTDISHFSQHLPSGVVLSGGPMSVLDDDAPSLNAAVLEWNVPVLGVCYGLQIMAHQEQPGSVAIMLR